MAVWIYAYGKNGLLNYEHEEILELLNLIIIDEVKILDSILEATIDKESIDKYYIKNRKQIENTFANKSDSEYKKYLDSINYPNIKRENLVDYFIADGLKKENNRNEIFQRTYNNFKRGVIKSNWETAENGYFNKLCNFDAYGGLRLWLLNDLIGISGPFEIFSIYGTFQKSISRQSREYFHTLFKNIFRVFHSNFILYTHEWAGLDDEEDKEFDLKKLKEQSDWHNNTSNSIHDMNGFYYEDLN